LEDSLAGDDVTLRPRLLAIEDELTKTDVVFSRPDVVELRAPIVVDSLLACKVDIGNSLLTLTIGVVAISLAFNPIALDVAKPEIKLSDPEVVELEAIVV